MDGLADKRKARKEYGNLLETRQFALVGKQRKVVLWLLGGVEILGQYFDWGGRSESWKRGGREGWMEGKGGLKRLGRERKE